MRISMSRGDIKWHRFKVYTPEDTPSEIPFTSVYFTVKKNPKDRDYLFRKSLTQGQIYRIGQGDYQFKIDAQDTTNLTIGNYKFDIQITYKDLLKETFVGDFVLREEITYPENEDPEEHAEFTLPEYNIEPIILQIPDYHIIQLESPVTVSSGEGGGVTSYSALQDKPRINHIILDGDMTLEELGIQPAGSYADSPLSIAELEDILEGVEVDE